MNPPPATGWRPFGILARPAESAREPRAALQMTWRDAYMGEGARIIYKVIV